MVEVQPINPRRPSSQKVAHLTSKPSLNVLATDDKNGLCCSDAWVSFCSWSGYSLTKRTLHGDLQVSHDAPQRMPTTSFAPRKTIWSRQILLWKPKVHLQRNLAPTCRSSMLLLRRPWPRKWLCQNERSCRLRLFALQQRRHHLLHAHNCQRKHNTCVVPRLLLKRTHRITV